MSLKFKYSIKNGKNVSVILKNIPNDAFLRVVLRRRNVESFQQISEAFQRISETFRRRRPIDESFRRNSERRRLESDLT
jgi:hypothetical protein